MSKLGPCNQDNTGNKSTGLPEHTKKWEWPWLGRKTGNKHGEPQTPPPETWTLSPLWRTNAKQPTKHIGKYSQ